MEKKTELQLNAIAGARRKELETYQRTLDMQWLNSRMEDGRTGRCLALIQREAEMEKDYQERTDHAAIVNAKVAKETALAYEIAKAQREETVAYQRRHYLRDRDPMLRTLSKKLQAAYVCRDLQQQIRNNQYRRLQEKAEDKKAIEKLSEALYSDQDYQEVEKRAKAERNSKYCQELQQQLVSRQTERQCQYEDRLIEKKMLDEVMRTIADEDQSLSTSCLLRPRGTGVGGDAVIGLRGGGGGVAGGIRARRARSPSRYTARTPSETDYRVPANACTPRARELQQKREQMEKMRREMVTFKMAQEAWRAKQKQIVFTEETEIEKQQQAITSRDAAVIAERERRQQEKDKIKMKIAAEVLANENERQERDNIIKLLQEQERLEANVQDDVASREKKERIKRETKEALNEQMQIRKQQEMKEKEFAANYLKQLRQKMAEEEAKEIEKQRLVREKNRKHCELLLKQAEEQRQSKISFLKDEAQRVNNIFECEHKWHEEVSKERERIIKEHVPGLLGYLQAGVIKKSDLPAVQEGAKSHPELANLNIEDLTLTKRPKRFAKCNAQCQILREL